MRTMDTTTTLIIKECGTCGITYAVSEAYDETLRKNHKMFWCPRGCERYYAAENEEERLRRELSEAQEEANRKGTIIKHVRAERDFMERSRG